MRGDRGSEPNQRAVQPLAKFQRERGANGPNSIALRHFVRS